MTSSLTIQDLLATFASGFLNPVLTPVHLLGLCALALLVSPRAPMARVMTAACFIIGLAAGLAALALAVGATPARNVVLGVAAVSGILAAMAWELPRFAVWALAAVIGATVGLDSPPETVSLTLGTIMLAAAWLGASIALAALIAMATWLYRAWPIATRVLGSWVAASALLALTLRLVR